MNQYHVKMPGIPHWTLLDQNGSVLVNLKPADQFGLQGALESELIAEFLEKWSLRPSDGPKK